MKKITLILALMLGAVAMHGAETATSLLAKVSHKITAAKSVTARFKLTSPDAAVIQGDFASSGDKFAFTSSEAVNLYDGKSQWTVDHQLKEITAVVPTDEELAQINPFAVIRGYDKMFKAKLLSNAGDKARIELFPKVSGSFKRLVLVVNTKTLLPLSLLIVMPDGNSLNIDISDIKLGANIPSSRFVINRKSYPGYEFIDMR